MFIVVKRVIARRNVLVVSCCSCINQQTGPIQKSPKPMTDYIFTPTTRILEIVLLLLISPLGTLVVSGVKQTLHYSWTSCKRVTLKDWFCLVGFYGKSTIVGYSMVNPLYIYIYIYIYIYHVVRLARISQTLFLHVSLSFIAFGRSSGLYPVSSHSCCMNVRAVRPAFDWPYAGVHRSTSLTISSLLLQHCPACLVGLACIVFVIGGRWPYTVKCKNCSLKKIQFSVIIHISSILHIDRMVSGATTSDQSVHGDDGNEGVLRISQSSSSTEVSPSDCLGVIFKILAGDFFPPCWGVVSVFYSLCRLGYKSKR